MIIYEGHLAYQDLFDVPSAHRDTAPDSYFEEELDSLEGGAAARRREPRRRRSLAAAGAGPPQPVNFGTMDGLPVVVLQSCDSLDERVLWRIDELGGVALVGSVDAHSQRLGQFAGPGDERRDSVPRGRLGEALRDAQNFLFCLGDLKTRRGQKEQAKSRRVALSFRLWGDPRGCRRMRRRRTSGFAFVGAMVSIERLEIDVPDRRLPEARNAQYFARMFPGSQSSGMVKPGGNGRARQVTPVYFFRAPLPGRFCRRRRFCPGWTAVEPAGAPHRPGGRSFIWCSCPRRRGPARRLPFAGALRFRAAAGEAAQ